ncbi:Neutral zinc metallopeptidase [Phytophthora megakarya]|uniref:Neutral zinc metallopeptidase n=1 Tax=Phytophthora megakarya TaxID=4795 RepID=A0A225V1R7_9STRA|nr:Neutral zinc metallopeptidase [Phytophthora megakarya]
MPSNTSYSSFTHQLLVTTAIVGLVASSVVSAAPVGSSTNGSAPFGDITSGSGKCVVGNPNEYVTSADLEWIWSNRIGPNAKQSDSNWNVMDNKNWIMDHLVKNQGTINYCVRWDSTNKLSKSVASKFEAMLTRQYNAWNEWLVGYNCWPYSSIKVNVVGWAVRDTKLLEWSDDSLGKIYQGYTETEDDFFKGVPTCPKACHRVYDYGTDGWTDTSGCTTEPFDLSLTPKQGLEGGFGYDWGQNVNLENMLAAIDDEQLTIVAHEIGHGFGLPDFYGSSDMPNKNFPSCLMRAGSAASITPADGWMLRRVLEHTKSRYNF